MYNDGILFCPAIPSIIPFASMLPVNVEIPPTLKFVLILTPPVTLAIPVVFEISKFVLSCFICTWVAGVISLGSSSV